MRKYFLQEKKKQWEVSYVLDLQVNFSILVFSQMFYGETDCTVRKIVY